MKIRGFSEALLLATAIVCLIAPSVLAAEGEKKAAAGDSELVKAARNASARGPAAKVYTTDDLNKMYSGGSTDDEAEATPKAGSAPVAGSPGKPKTPAAGETQEAGDPLEWIESRKTAAAERSSAIAAAEQKVAAARARITAIEKRLLAVSNPFLARPEAPDDEEKSKEWAGQDSRQRRAASQTELEEARKELAAAEAELSRVRSSS